MPSILYEDFESKHFKVVTMKSPALYGYHILHKPTGLTSLWDTGQEAMVAYGELKSAWHKSRKIFDSVCSEYFQEGAMVHDNDEQEGFLRQGQFVKLED